VPTIEVRGRDSVRGAVLFVFDCSGSMKGGNFAAAQRELSQALEELSASAGQGLRAGLMTYGHRTPVTGNEEDLLYKFRKRAGERDSLTSRGIAERNANPQGFADRYPHPDRDVEERVPLSGGSAEAVLAQVRALREKDCVGVTPLYYSIRQAMQTGFRDLPNNRELRQVVVITDGVNMAYNTHYDRRENNYTAGEEAGKPTMAEDRRELVAALASSRNLRVTVVLFGSRATDFERDQYLSLKKIETDHPGVFEVVTLSDATEIARSIREALPKTGIELAAATGNAPSQTLSLQQETPVARWENDGLLRDAPDQRLLRVSVAGEANQKLTVPLALVGGERVVVQYDTQGSQPALVLLGDERRERASQPAAVRSGQADPAYDLRIAALDPHRKAGTLDMLFVRLRTEQSRTQFTRRPKYAWAEVEPVAAPSAEPAIPVLDAAWEDHTEWPVLQIPVRAWPNLATQAKIRVWFRYSDPKELLAQTTLRRGVSTPPLESVGFNGRWLVEESGGEAGQQRKISVTFEGTGSPSYASLLEHGLWLSPPADQIHRRLAKDGSRAVHEFQYTRPGVSDAPLELRIASRQQFERGAYFAELTLDVAN
jgi:hypothetical protein